MFPLACTRLPADPASLRAAIEEGLRQTISAAHEMVTIENKNYPELTALRVSLDGATMGDRPPQLGVPAGEVSPAFGVDTLEISGTQIRVQGAAVDLQCRAREVTIGQARDGAGNLVLMLQKAAEGLIEVGLPVAELENLVRAGAQTAAAAQGVTIENVRIALQTRGDRALDVTVQVRAKKLFLSANVRLSGSVAIDEQLTAHLSGLTCTGEGALGSLACGFLTPHLQRFDGREFSLLALPLGEVKLRDVRVAAGDELRVSAQFGSA